MEHLHDSQALTAFALKPTCVATHVHRLIVVSLNSPVVRSAGLSLSLSICQHREVALPWPNSHHSVLKSEPCLIVHELCLSVCPSRVQWMRHIPVEIFSNPSFFPVYA